VLSLFRPDRGDPLESGHGPLLIGELSSKRIGRTGISKVGPDIVKLVVDVA
jgi:hypothetical protein